MCTNVHNILHDMNLLSSLLTNSFTRPPGRCSLKTISATLSTTSVVGAPAPRVRSSVATRTSIRAACFSTIRSFKSNARSPGRMLPPTPLFVRYRWFRQAVCAMSILLIDPILMVSTRRESERSCTIARQSARNLRIMTCCAQIF